MKVQNAQQHVLVTGGAGFIGSHVVDALLSEGYRVSILDNLSSGSRENVSSQAKLYETNITDKDAVTKLLHELKPDIINHHAAHILVGHSVADPQFDASVNILGLLNLMEAAKDVGVKKVIMASTGGAMYGNQPTPFTEDMPASPLSPYGVSKRAGELYLNYYHEQYGIEYIVLRYANVYGPRQNSHGESGVFAVFSEMIAHGKTPLINGDGTHTRDYVHVRDVSRANILALKSSYVGELNIGTGIEISTNDVFHRLVTAMGKSIPESHGPDRPGEQATSALSSEKAKRILGWEPSVQLEEGIMEVAAWYAHRTK